jgi:methyltransferase of ATP-grasp peptide maturase system
MNTFDTRSAAARDFEIRAAAARVGLADQLTAAGVLPDPEWALAFATVPRHLFAPAAYTVDPVTGTVGRMLRADAPCDTNAYLSAVYSDDAIVTQLSDAGVATSSSTQPAVMATMLHHLDVAPGQRVLEVGTGTGYNAALLSERLGDEQVVSVDIDPGLVDTARDALAEAGYTPLVAAHDGLDGYPLAAPYDRIIVTCSTQRVPLAWLEQVRPGGLILANLSHGVVPLRVTDNHTATGRFVPEVAGFIQARTADGPAEWTFRQLLDVCMPNATAGTQTGDTRPARTDLDAFADMSNDEFDFFWRLLTPGLTWCGLDAPDGFIHCLGDAATGSWARAQHHGDHAEVHQHGPRRLWDELRHDHQRWTTAGRPANHQVGLTITRTGEHLLWIDSPHHTHGTLPTPTATPQR